MSKQSLTCLVAATLITAGCQSTPTIEQEREKSLVGELVVSLGVRRLFEDPELVQLEAGVNNDVKCIRERHVGTHMVKRICRTKSEWDYLANQTRETHQQNRVAGVCGGGGPISRGDCGDGRGSF